MIIEEHYSPMIAPGEVYISFQTSARGWLKLVKSPLWRSVEKYLDNCEKQEKLRQPQESSDEAERFLYKHFDL